MAYSEDVGKAGMIAAAAHVGAVDKAGAPYIEHPKRVAARVSEPREKVVAWLHDVVEDTGVTLEEIEKEFGKETAEAVNAITHRKDEPWADYLCRVKANPIARAVKIADLIDNSNLSRLPEVKPKDVKRQAKYNRALYFLMNVEGV
ncbi:MAG: HD domain-containing protein [Clostridia bacterium]|nr:HD domain-containing protein [Clostridia bacterium]